MPRRIYGFLAIAAVALLAAMVTVPIVILIVLGLKTSVSLRAPGFTLGNFQGLLSDPGTWESVRNTLAYTVGGAFLATALGAGLAWAISSVNIPARSVLRVLPICVLLLPPLVKDPAWIMLFAPHNGLVNLFLHDQLGITNSLFNVYTLWGMISVAGIFGAPFAYVIMLQPFGSIDRSMIEASTTSGSRLPNTLRRVMVPMVRPAVVSAATFQVILIAGSFETAVLIGQPGNIPTFMAQVYNLVSNPVHGFNIAAAQSSLYLILTLAMVACYIAATRNERRFVAISGRGHQHAVLEAPVLRWILAAGIVIYSVLGFLGPLALTVITSFIPFYTASHGNPFHQFTVQNYRGVFKSSQLIGAVETSTLIAIAAAVGVLVVASFLAYFATKSRSRFRRVCEFIGMAPIAIPGLVYSVGLLFTVLSVPGLAPVAYGTKGLMVAAEIIVFLPIGMRLLSSVMIQLPDELIEASRMGGAGRLRTFRSVILPLLRPALIYTACVVFVLSYRELGAVVLLVAQNTITVPFVSLSFWVQGGFPMLAALNVVTLIVPLAAVGVVLMLDRLTSVVPSRSRRTRRRLPNLVLAQGPK
jgi:iron(III) transport system permease protein